MSIQSQTLAFQGHVIDPMWGAFPITQLEQEILQTPPLCRLEQIKQMGLAFLDFPSLSHTRLEHSLGVMYVADKIFAILEASSRSLHREEYEELFSARNRQLVRLAALLHDLGHPPFSHAVELTFKRFPSLLQQAAQGARRSSRLRAHSHLFTNYSHETFTHWIIESSKPIARILEAFGYGPLKQEIANLAIGKAQGELAAFNPIISGDFDADKIDYLIRDNRRSGFAIGLSPDELLDSVKFRANRADGEVCYELTIDRHALAFVNSVLSARERLINRVHLARHGRTGTQMLITFLFETLFAPEPRGRAELAKRLIGIHRDCTDYTFFSELKSRLSPQGPATSGVRNLVLHPSQRVLWKEYAHLDFHHMHPCLRLFSYIAATEKYSSPGELTFKAPGDQRVLLEPSCRPSPEFSLLVDYSRTEKGAFDFIGAAENPAARAILSQSMSNLDVYAYRIGEREMPYPGRELKCEGETKGFSDYTRTLLPGKPVRRGKAGSGDACRFVATAVIQVARQKKRARNDLLPIEYLLLLLESLERALSTRFKGARSIYIYSGEHFINDFLPGLVDRKPFPLPEGLLAPGRSGALNSVGGARAIRNPGAIFRELQRLRTFGLIEVRRNPVFHQEVPAGSRVRRTRGGIFSSREEFRVNAWGRHYVENEIDGRILRKFRNSISGIQRSVEANLAKIGLEHDRLVESFHPATKSRLESYGRFLEKLAKQVKAIAKAGGCAMIFSDPSSASRGRGGRSSSSGSTK